MPTMDCSPVAPDWLARRRKPHCLLCNGLTAFTNVYVPGPGSRLAPPAGKGRIIIYSLCESCGRNLGCLSRQIEARIEQATFAPQAH